jgi:ELWxxDGT repeat protein
MTDGTSAATSELTVAGAYSSGLNPLYIAGFGTRALFDGHDSSSHLGLWVTDGTATGTSELTNAVLSVAIPSFEAAA